MTSHLSVSGNICTVPTFNSYTKCRAARSNYTTAHLIATQFPGHECMDHLATECIFDSQAMWAIDVLGLFFDMLFRVFV